MKKLIVCLLCAVMVLSMIPAMSLSVSAAVEGDWTTRRNVKDYPDEGEPDDDYTPAPGYQYTSEGFHTVTADFTNSTPAFTVESKEAQNLKDGLSMEIRIDQFSYKGESGSADEWICLSLWDANTVCPGDLNYGNGWLCLIRGAGDGSAQCLSFWTIANNEDGVGGDFGHKGTTSISPEVDDNGREHYTLDVEWNGSAYDIKVCGVTVAGMSEISDKMKAQVESGDYYVGVSFHTTVAGGVADMSILEFNGSTPAGDDSKEAEANVRVIAEIADSSTVPANQPALLFDATKTSFTKDPTSSGMQIAPQGDNSYHFTMTVADAFMTWGIKNTLSYEAADFPYLVMVFKDFYGNGGAFYYGSDSILSTVTDCMITWSPYESDDSCFLGKNEEYTFLVMDLGSLDEGEDETWAGRINFIRMDFNGMGVGDEFDLMFMGFFRSVEEARAYTDARLGLDASDDTGDGNETETEHSGQPAESDTLPAETGSSETVADSGNETKVEFDTIVPGGDEGCASVVAGGAVAVLLSAMAAAVALKKKH